MNRIKSNQINPSISFDQRYRKRRDSESNQIKSNQINPSFVPTTAVGENKGIGNEERGNKEIMK